MEFLDDELLQLISPEFSLLDEVTQKLVYRSYYSLTYNMVLYIVQDYSVVQDVIQEAFLKSLKKRPVNQDSKHCKAWLKTVARNLSLNYLRKLKKISTQSDLDSVFCQKGFAKSNQGLDDHQWMIKKMDQLIDPYHKKCSC
ncbi:RNA polymerase sigma factor [uncultured Brevibacillus sp.]|uniref:RNA polymerase sigma factor n=1 Tax=uncultured Brevibacillus sp. TaxID=169970 RepID=UPI002591834B|nr:sigma factor [uncultured Brevibacillus sp.]